MKSYFLNILKSHSKTLKCRKVLLVNFKCDNLNKAKLLIKKILLCSPLLCKM